MSDHTPTPWDQGVARGWDVVIDRDGCFVAGEIGNPPDAAFIVRACNAHDDLVKALEDAAECLMWNGDDPKETLQGYIMDAHDRIRAALAKAKGE